MRKRFTKDSVPEDLGILSILSLVGADLWMINTAGKNLTLQTWSAAAVLSALKEEPGLSIAETAERAGIAEARAVSVCSWLGAAGWIERNRLTNEGSVVLTNDPSLESNVTKALLLARLVQGITIWSTVVNEYLFGCVTGNNTATPEAAFDTVLDAQQRVSEQTRKDVGRVFSMLEREDALGSLGLLSFDADRRYRVHSFSPPAALIAYLVSTDFPDPGQTVPFGWLSSPGAPYRVFLLTGDLAGVTTEDLERSGLVTSERAHGFNRFVLRQGLDPSDLLRRAVYDCGTRS